MTTLKPIHFSLTGFALAIFALTSSQTAGAANPIIYDNGAPLLTGGNNMGIAWQAEDFSLKANATVTDIHFWTLEVPGDYRNSISWQIRDDATGSPGASVVAGADGLAGVTRTATGNSATIGGVSYNEFAYDFNVSPLNLGPGTYWLNLHNGPLANLGDPNDFLWAWAAGNATLLGQESYDSGSSWSSNLSEHAFQLTGTLTTSVPEPVTFVLLSIGLAALRVGRPRAAGSDLKNKFQC